MKRVFRSIIICIFTVLILAGNTVFSVAESNGEAVVIELKSTIETILMYYFLLFFDN